MINWSSFLVFLFVPAFTPGANNIMSMSNASRVGFVKNLRYILGVIVGFMIVIPICAFSGSTLMNFLPQIEPVMLVLGAGYMIYLAWKLYRSSYEIEVSDKGSAGFVAGIMLQFVNPKFYIYVLTSLTVYILPVYKEPLKIIAASSVLVVIGCASLIVWALFGSIVFKKLNKHKKIVNTIFALLLVYCAISLFIK